MFASLVLGWLVLSLPFAVLVGKCISFGQAGVTWPSAEDVAAGEATTASGCAAGSADEADSGLGTEVPTLPAQRGPLVPARHGQQAI